MVRDHYLKELTHLRSPAAYLSTESSTSSCYLARKLPWIPDHLAPLILPLRNQLKIRKKFSEAIAKKILNSRYTHASSLATYFTAVVVSYPLCVASQKASSVKNNPGLAVPSISILWIFGSITLQKKLYNVVRNNATLIQLKAKTVANVA
jgi:hypothetical protein